jgi:hypothetical protein
MRVLRRSRRMRRVCRATWSSRALESLEDVDRLAAEFEQPLGEQRLLNTAMRTTAGKATSPAD